MCGINRLNVAHPYLGSGFSGNVVIFFSFYKSNLSNFAQGSRDADPKEEFLSRWSNRMCEFSFMEKRVCVDEIEESGEFTGKPYLT
jgi:phage-related protein